MYYKLGNISDVILRSVDASPVGSHVFRYENEPYTILKDKEVEINFHSITKEMKGTTNMLQFNQDYPEELVIHNVELNNKILNLLYQKTNEGICTEYQNCNSDENSIVFLNKIKNEYYQVFIFDEDGKLENAYGTLKENYIRVNKPNSSYLIIYGFLGETNYSLAPLKNIYFSIDMITKGNNDDITTSTYYHFDKCALQISKDMYFNNDINSIDLKFKILDLENSTITID